MGRVITYDEKTGYNDGDYLLLDNGEGGTKRIRADRVGIQLDPSLLDPNKAAPASVVGDKFGIQFENTFLHIDGVIDTPAIVSGSWAAGGAVAGGNRGRTTSLIRCNGKISFGLGNYTKYKFGYVIYTSADLSQYTNSGWVTADVLNLDFSGYAIGFSFAHLSGSGAIPASELEEIHNLFSISVTGQMLTLREEIETLQSDVASLKSAHENNLLPQIGANPFRFNPCYDHLFVNNKTDAVIPHESLYHVRMSKKIGFDVIEANVSATSDGVYVVNHLENYKFGNYFHHVDGVTDISNTLLSSVTWDWVVQNVRYNSTIAKYQTRPCRLEEFLQECKQQDLIPFISSSDTNVIAIADQYMGKDNYIAYGASREDCPHAIIYHWVSSLTTKEAILAYCENIGKPFIFGLGNVSDFTDAGLKELVETLHDNGYMIGISYSDNNVHKYSAFGFDTIGTIRHINRIREGNLCNLNSIFDFSGFTYTNATLSDGVLTFSAAGTISPNIENTSHLLCGFDVEIDMIGTVTIPAVGEQKSSYNLTSDGSYPVFCATPIINGSPAITINVASGTVIKDISFKASVFTDANNSDIAITVDEYYKAYDYDEIVYTNTNGDTSKCYIVHIPFTDSPQLRVSYSDPLGTTKTVREFAEDLRASIAVNGGMTDLSGGTYTPHGVVISDGAVIKDSTYTASYDNYTLGIKSDGTFRYYNSATMSGQTMIADGITQAVTGVGPLIESGAISPHVSTYPVAYAARQSIGYTGSEYIIYTCDYGTGISTGMTLAEVAQEMLSLGCIEAYCLDGGGSTSTNIMGTKINANVDDHGTTDRKVSTCIYVSTGKESGNPTEPMLAALIANASSDANKALREIRNNFTKTIVYGITASSTDSIVDIAGLRNGYYIVFVIRSGVASNTSSVYIVTVDNGAVTGLNAILEGTAGTAPRIKSDGTLAANTSTSTQTYIICAMTIGFR